MTRGAEQLRRHLGVHGAQKKFVEEFNNGLPSEQQVDRPMVSRWVTGKRPPSTVHMARIEDLTGIAMRAWAEAPEEKAAS